MAFTRAVANAASRIGMGQSVESVARATLEACRDSYPGVTDGGILLISEDRSTLTPIPVVLSPGGVANAEPAALFSLNPGSGLAGSAFTEGAARLAATQQALRLVHVGRVPVPGSPITDRGVRCAVAAPLRSPGRGVIGVLTLGSSVREGLWGADDLVVVQGLADQAATGIERAWLYEELHSQARTDALTGLGNLRTLRAALEGEVRGAAAMCGSVAVIFADLDGLKEINDLLSHDAGDRALRMMAATLRDCLRASDTAARYGGDEFVCVLPGATSAEADATARRIADVFRERLGRDPQLSATASGVSCGVAVMPEDGTGADQLLALADVRLRRLKGGSRLARQIGFVRSPEIGLGTAALAASRAPARERRDRAAG
jgi:diguanylate cyclase (GGDEF)-like protein